MIVLSTYVITILRERTESNCIGESTSSGILSSMMCCLRAHGIPDRLCALELYSDLTTEVAFGVHVSISNLLHLYTLLSLNVCQPLSKAPLLLNQLLQCAHHALNYHSQR
jgi:hypothetical protein